MYQSLKKLEDKLERQDSNLWEDIKLSQNLRILIISKAKKPGDIERVVLHTGREVLGVSGEMKGNRNPASECSFEQG